MIIFVGRDFKGLAGLRTTQARSLRRIRKRLSQSARERNSEEDRPERVVYGVVDEDRKVSINTASQAVLLRLPVMTDEIRIV